MLANHYVCRRVGDDFVVVRVDPMDVLKRAAYVGVGAGLACRYLKKSGGISGLLSLAGISLFISGWTGQSVRDLFKGPCSEDSKTAPAHDHPSYRDAGIPSPQVPVDDVEESSMSSFPASDPPSSHQTTAVQAQSDQANFNGDDSNIKNSA